MPAVVAWSHLQYWSISISMTAAMVGLHLGQRHSGPQSWRRGLRFEAVGTAEPLLEGLVPEGLQGMAALILLIANT